MSITQTSSANIHPRFYPVNRGNPACARNAYVADGLEPGDALDSLDTRFFTFFVRVGDLNLANEPSFGRAKLRRHSDSLRFCTPNLSPGHDYDRKTRTAKSRCATCRRSTIAKLPMPIVQTMCEGRAFSSWMAIPARFMHAQGDDKPHQFLRQPTPLPYFADFVGVVFAAPLAEFADS
jgi:hypothetical protein